MSLGFKPSAGQIIPNQTGKKKNQNRKRTSPICHHRAENSLLSQTSECCNIYKTTGNQTYSEGLRLDHVMKTEAGSRPDSWVVCCWCRFNISRETKWENNKLKAEPSCFICSYVKHRAVSPACTDLYTWEHLSSPELTAAGTASALTRTHSVSSNHWGGLVNDRDSEL